jgi:hypothetical protein
MAPGIHATINGDVSGQIALGDNNSQSQTQVMTPVPHVDIHELQQIFSQLKSRIEAEAPADKKDAALERVDELEQAIQEKEPDLSTMEYVKTWFGKNMPGLAGAVVSVVVHPIVGKLVEAAGDAIAAEFKLRFRAS